jgi:hypothetical protein
MIMQNDDQKRRGSSIIYFASFTTKVYMYNTVSLLNSWQLFPNYAETELRVSLYLGAVYRI